MDEGAVPVTEYWFARRFPIGNPRSGMAPVHWKGWAVVAAFFAGMLAGAALAAWLISIGEPVRGVAVFAALAFGSGLVFVRAAHKKGDHINTVADYRGGKLRV